MEYEYQSFCKTHPMCYDGALPNTVAGNYSARSPFSFHLSCLDPVSTPPTPCTPSSGPTWLFWTLSHAFHHLCLSRPFPLTYN